MCFLFFSFFFFFFNDTATTEIYTLSLHDALPISPRRFARAADQLSDVAEDQLTLASGIGGGDQLIGSADQAADDRQLLGGPLLGEGLEPEPLGHERQGLQRPLLQGRVVVVRLLQGDEVAQSPGDLVAPALVVTVVPLRGAEEGRQFSSDRRLLGEHDPHATLASVISPTPLQHRSASGAWERARDSGEATTVHPGRELRGPTEPIGLYLYYIYYSTHKRRGREERRERLGPNFPGRLAQENWRGHPDVFLEFRNALMANAGGILPKARKQDEATSVFRLICKPTMGRRHLPLAHKS